MAAPGLLLGPRGAQLCTFDRQRLRLLSIMCHHKGYNRLPRSSLSASCSAARICEAITTTPHLDADCAGVAFHRCLILEKANGTRIVKKYPHKNVVKVRQLDIGDCEPLSICEKDAYCWTQGHYDDKGPISRVGTSAAVVGFSLLIGPFWCSIAWAGPGVAVIQESLTWLGNLDDFQSGFVSAFLLIFFSEIGDKTFFIAAVLASRKSNAAVFTGTFAALVAMTFISVFVGRTFHYIDGILPFSLGENELPIDDLAAVVLLVYFGVSTLLEAASMKVSKTQEEQQEAELAIAGIDGAGQVVANTALATFALVFVAEWGDKSFFSTVALSAASSPLGVVLGAVIGHGIATLIAVVGGSFLSNYISEKAIAYTGGVLFLGFAVLTLLQILQ